ncbi:hypothetical protein NXS98_07325 [Fontisphaera persica]|uniref:hypothetical protein n=1 Tax=Fontisphaera persica TaxID=2974023 RepID=UPI0024BFB11C|nr:hypothetical protein [Fontisphaera persica]WCJ61285.1 hypothetical protein NXS98_07325 [Fontisphaera persica]
MTSTNGLKTWTRTKAAFQSPQSRHRCLPDRDQKLAELKKLIAAKVRHPTQNKVGNLNRKVLVFTAFADTATYLYENLHQWALKELGIHSALVVGTGKNRTTYQPEGLQRPTDYHHILINFSPISKRRERIRSMPQQGRLTC